MLLGREPAFRAKQLRLAFIKDAPIAIMWSPKAACTTVMKWVFLQNGTLEEALAYSHWIHNYRTKVYQKSENYAATAKRFKRRDFYVVKIARDPFDRTVSSYLQAYRHKYADQELSQVLGLEVDRDKRFSFRQFVTYLGRTDLKRCNAHHRAQATDPELAWLFRLVPDQVIRIEDGLESALSKLEAQFDLTRTDFTDKLFASPHHTTRIEADHSYADLARFQPKRVPPARAFYDKALAESVRSIYRHDFRCYGYDDSTARIVPE